MFVICAVIEMFAASFFTRALTDETGVFSSAQTPMTSCRRPARSPASISMSTACWMCVTSAQVASRMRSGAAFM